MRKHELFNRRGRSLLKLGNPKIKKGLEIRRLIASLPAKSDKRERPRMSSKFLTKSFFHLPSSIPQKAKCTNLILGHAQRAHTGECSVRSTGNDLETCCLVHN